MKTAIIILAAGKGKRMDSDIPKVLHKLNNKTLIKRVIETSKKMSPLKMILVIGHKKEMIKKELENYTDIEYVIQSEQKGTGHAVKMCFNALQGFDGDILILSGDVPLISFSTLQSLRNIKNQLKAHAAILTANMDPPTGYGRIIKNNQLLSKIVEHKDCTPDELSVNEINAGVYLIENRLLMEYIPKIDNKNNQGEYYLPDVFNLMIKDNYLVSTYKTEETKEISGINNQEQLSELNNYLITHEKTKETKEEN